MNRLKLANEYIKQYKNKVIKTYQPGYHIHPQVGWMNDPNGLIEFNGEYHIFYQYHPYHTQWGPMHWGHYKTKDFIHFNICDIAMAPDQKYDKDGCFSGNAIVKDGKMHLLYTSHLHPNNYNNSIYIQQQSLAISDDGIHFTKHQNNPVIKTSNIPNGGNSSDFRDPKVWEKDGVYYCIVSNLSDNNTSRILLYKSQDLVEWSFFSVLVEGTNKMGKMWECPDIFPIDDNHHCLVVSPMFFPEDESKYTNIYSSIYLIGTLNYETGKFTYTKFDEIDSGLDFYAPQILVTSDGRKIMIAWMQTWERNYPLDDLKHGFNGIFTVPRELTIQNNQLFQKPIREYKNLREHAVTFNKVFNGETEIENVRGSQVELVLDIDLSDSNLFDIKLLQCKEEYFLISYNRTTSYLTIDRSNILTKITGLEDHQVDYRRVVLADRPQHLHLQIFIDKMTIEVFAQEGQYALSSTVFPKYFGKNIIFSADGDAFMSGAKYSLKSIEFE